MLIAYHRVAALARTKRKLSGNFPAIAVDMDGASVSAFIAIFPVVSHIQHQPIRGEPFCKQLAGGALGGGVPVSKSFVNILPMNLQSAGFDGKMKIGKKMSLTLSRMRKSSQGRESVQMQTQFCR